MLRGAFIRGSSSVVRSVRSGAAPLLRSVHAAARSAPSASSSSRAVWYAAAASAVAVGMVAASSSLVRAEAGKSEQQQSGAAPDAGKPASPAAAAQSGVEADAGHPGTALLSSSGVDALVWRRDRPNELSGAAGQPYSILLSVYDPECVACATQKHVVWAMGAALANQPNVRVLRYNIATNDTTGFLTEDELNTMPLIKFFPALPAAASADAPEHADARTAVTYDGQPNVRDLLDFIAQHTPAHAPVDLAAAQAALIQSAPETDAALTRAVEERLKLDPSYHIYNGSPCGAAMFDWMRTFLSAGYLTRPVEDSERERVFTAFQRCMQVRDKQMREYWEFVHGVADEQLERYKEQDAQRAQAGDSDDKPAQHDNKQEAKQ